MKQNWKFLLIIFIAFTWMIIFPMWSERVTKDPLDVPISLNPAGKIEHNIEIPVPEKYEIRLVFERTDLSVERLRTLIGGHMCPRNGPCFKGIPVPIKWSLSEGEFGNDVAGGEIISQGITNWHKYEVDRHVGFIKVKPGRYVFRAAVLQGVPELESIRSSLVIHAPGYTTWQFVLVIYGKVAIIICGLFLIFGILKNLLNE